MKKILSVLLTAAMLCSFVGCSFLSDSDDIKQIETSTENKESETDEETEESETTPVESETEEATSSETTPPEEEQQDATITEQVCFDYEGVKVTAKELTNDLFWGLGVKLLIENNTDKDYSVSIKEVIVNNCMVYSLFSCDVAAGKKANETLDLSSSSLEAAGIKNIGQIEIYFTVRDDETYETVYESECIVIKTSLFDTMDTAVDDSGNEIYNKDGIRIVGKYVDESTFWGSSVLLYIENKTEKNFTVSCDDMSINGFMVTPYFSSTVYSGKYTIDEITIMSSSLEENDITSIETIGVKFHIYSPDTYDTIADTEEITIEVK